MVEIKSSKKIIVILLSLLSIGISLFFYYYINKIDDRYTDIVEREADIFLKVQTLTNNAYRGYISVSRVVNARSDDERDKMLAERKFFTGKNDSLLSLLIQEIDTTSVDQASLHELVSAREKYKENYRFLVNHIKGDKDSSYKFFNTVYTPSFFTYQDKVAQFITVNKEHHLRNSSLISEDVTQKSIFMLIFGISPLIIFTVYLMLLGVMLIYLLRK